MAKRLSLGLAIHCLCDCGQVTYSFLHFNLQNCIMRIIYVKVQRDVKICNDFFFFNCQWKIQELNAHKALGKQEAFKKRLSILWASRCSSRPRLTGVSFCSCILIA